MNIISSIMPDDKIDSYVKLDEKLICINPPESLIELYLISRLTQDIGLRAEHDYSIENITIMPKTLGKFNPNYGILITKIRTVCKNKDIESFILLCDEINKYVSIPFPLRKWENYCYSIKHSTCLTETLEFIISKYNILL